MTPEERQRRYRQNLSASGGRFYGVRIDGDRWRAVEKAAKRERKLPGELIGRLLVTILDRFIEVDRRMWAMIDAGASHAEAADFYNENFVRPLKRPLPDRRPTPRT